MSIDKFQITFELKQHTPIIHFQHDQEGATLRATELKPKLDLYIIKKSLDELSNPAVTYQHDHDAREKFKSIALHQINEELNSTGHYKPEWKGWLVGKGKSKHVALHYKIKINSTIDIKYIICNNLTKDQQDVLTANNLLYLIRTPYFAQESELKSIFLYEQQERKKNDRFVWLDIPVSLNNDGIEKFSKWGTVSKSNSLQNPNQFNITITCLNKELLSKIDIHLPKCLAFENFGTRQSKGFGSFTINKFPNGVEFTEKDFENALETDYKFIYKKTINPPNQLQKIFETIQSDYKLLKSGRNSNERAPYVKSKLFLYAVNQTNPIRWEKRKIKQEINNTPITTIVERVGGKIKLKYQNKPVFQNSNSGNWADAPPNFDYRYLRSVLGVAEQIEFLSEFTPNDVADIKPTGNFKNVVKISSADGIDRFRSPLIFKVFKNAIYIVGNSINNELFLNSKNGLNRIFNFTNQYKRNEKTISTPTNTLTPLKTPDKFDLDKFIDWALSDKTDEKISGYKRLHPKPEVNI